MWHFGIDLHRATVVLAAVNDAGKTVEPVTIRCEDTTAVAIHGGSGKREGGGWFLKWASND